MLLTSTTTAAKKRAASGRSTSVRSSSMAGDRMPAAPVRGAQDVDDFMKALRHPFKAELPVDLLMITDGQP